jgi:endonuclease-3
LTAPDDRADPVLSIGEAVTRLHSFYGPLVLPPHDAFMMYVWEVLNFHSAPVKRDAALGALRRIPALTPDSISKAVPKKLEAAVLLAGPYLDERIRALKAGAEVFRRHLDIPRRLNGPLLDARRAVRSLPQLGLAGFHRLLLFATTHPIIPADGHLTRVALRLGYGASAPNVRKQARAVRRALSAAVSADLDTRRQAVLYLSHHGHTTCVEYDPHCHVCPLLDGCPYGRARSRAGAAST